MKRAEATVPDFLFDDAHLRYPSSNHDLPSPFQGDGPRATRQVEGRAGRVWAGQSAAGRSGGTASARRAGDTRGRFHAGAAALAHAGAKSSRPCGSEADVGGDRAVADASGLVSIFALDRGSGGGVGPAGRGECGFIGSAETQARGEADAGGFTRECSTNTDAASAAAAASTASAIDQVFHGK